MTTSSNLTKSVSFNDDSILEYDSISAKIEYVVNEKFPDLDCSICLCPSIDPILCPNEHIFCRACIAKNYEYRKKCPQCNVDTEMIKYSTAVRPIQRHAARHRLSA